MTTTDIAEARKLCNEATSGPWAPGADLKDEDFFHVMQYPGTGRRIANVPNIHNTSFIAASRTLLPAALDEIEKRGEAIETLEKANRELATRATQAEKLLELDFKHQSVGTQRFIKDSNAEIDELTARAEEAEKDRDAAKSEICEVCHAFSDATGHGWNDDCKTCIWRGKED